MKAPVVMTVDCVAALISPAYGARPTEDEVTGEWTEYWFSRHGSEGNIGEL